MLFGILGFRANQSCRKKRSRYSWLRRPICAKYVKGDKQKCRRIFFPIRHYLPATLLLRSFCKNDFTNLILCSDIHISTGEDDSRLRSPQKNFQSVTNYSLAPKYRFCPITSSKFTRI